jgi:hypothetical protein
MCNFLSGVTLATGEIAIGELVDSHEAIIEGAGWGNADKRAERPGLCRWEYTPPDGDWRKPVVEWNFHVDDTVRPDWFTAEREAEAISRAQVILEKMMVHEGVHIVKTGRMFAYGSATVEASDSATVEASGSATVRASDSATVRASDSATVRASDSATVEASGSATVEASGSATVRAYNSATVRAYGSATVRASGSATVEASGSATVNTYGCKTVSVKDNAIEIDRRGDVVVIRGNARLEKEETK